MYWKYSFTTEIQKQQTLTNWLTSNETEVNCMQQYITVNKVITVYCTYLRVRRLNKFTENNTFHT